MPPVPDKLSAIWQNVNAAMDNNIQRSQLLEFCYTPKVHETFSSIAAGDLEADSINLGWIFKPLKRFYKDRIPLTEKVLKKISVRDEIMSAKIATLHRCRTNPDVERIEAENKELHVYFTKQLNNDRQMLAYIGEVMEDPRLKQVNPAMQGHSLDF